MQKEPRLGEMAPRQRSNWDKKREAGSFSETDYCHPATFPLRLRASVRTSLRSPSTLQRHSDILKNVGVSPTRSIQPLPIPPRPQPSHLGTFELFHIHAFQHLLTHSNILKNVRISRGNRISQVARLQLGAGRQESFGGYAPIPVRRT